MDKKFILDNIAEAERLVTEQPEQLFHLAAFRRRLDCGTLYCVAGLCAASAHFRALGWQWTEGNVPWIDLPDRSIDESSILDQQFGPDAFRLLFSYRGGSDYDPDGNACNRTDKEMALRRLALHRIVVEAL